MGEPGAVQLVVGYHPGGATSSSSGGGYDLALPICDISLKALHHLRKQSDKQLIRGLQQGSAHAEYFLHPPINRISLCFQDPKVEQRYRRCVHRQDVHEAAPTLASPSFNTYFDVVVSLVTYVVTALACFLMFGAHVLWLAFCLLATSCQALVVVLCFRQFLDPRGSGTHLRRLYDVCTRWRPWHALGLLLVSLPMMSILSNFSCQTFNRYPLHTDFFFFVFLIALLHFCNFTQLNCWAKSAVASIGVATVLAMLESDVCYSSSSFLSLSVNATTAMPLAYYASSSSSSSSPLPHTYSSLEPSFPEEPPEEEDDLSDAIQVSFSGTDTILYEVILDMLLLLILVWFLNREFEISYRLCFHANLLASQDRHKVQLLKNQADWLLHNIIPKHVAEHLKMASKYSENHQDVAIVFATIVNFNVLYDESYRGGKECLRVLNELIGDFDELLDRPEFHNVEKIKTIGTTLMAASGLNPQLRRTDGQAPHRHLVELMHFAFALLEAIDNFNRDLLEFNFVLRIGYNFGDVTAGVIGTTKLYYDIWGDAVNIASRMDSTGIGGHIQVPEHCVPVLDKYFELKPRGTIYVKGKDDMNVYLVVGKRTSLKSDEVDGKRLPEVA